MGTLTPDAIDAILKKNGKGPTDNSDVGVSFDEVDNFGNEESIKEMYASVASYNKMLQERITFINSSLTKVIPFTRENLYVICAFTGSGKTTIGANILHPIWKEGKKALIVSNEESKQDILYRVACIELGHNFNEYKKGIMPQNHQIECLKLFPEISKFIKILDASYKDNLTAKLEGVKNALTAVTQTDYSCVLIDYYQLIQKSIEDSSRSRYDVLNDLRIFLQGYIQRSAIPVVIFAQLHSLSKRAGVDLDQRVKECPAILDSATVVLEIVPNFDDKTTDILIKKDRFGSTGKKLTVAFDKGKFIDLTDEHRNRIAQEKLDDILDKAEETLDGS